MPGKPAIGLVKPFDGVTWQNVQQTQTIGKKNKKTSKYFTIRLPDHYTDQHGYHSDCYENFTDIPKSESETHQTQITPHEHWDY